MSTYEQEVARRWWALEAGALLPLSNGRSYRLLYAGRPGGSAGPDVRDAVLGFVTTRQGETRGEQGMAGWEAFGRRMVGDVEFHVRASDWRVHRHDSDPRYNQVILHVVLICDDPYPTVRQDAAMVPVCSLSDLPDMAAMPLVRGGDDWPCRRVMAAMTADERAELLWRAGWLRFEQKTHLFVEQLHGAEAVGDFDGYDVCLIAALAEGLGFGRDRDFFRAAGLHLLGKVCRVPEPLGRAAGPAALDGGRLGVLARLVERWRVGGAWRRLRGLLMGEVGDEGLRALRGEFCEAGLSLARADILICNIVLPFAVAVSLLEHDAGLAERANGLYGGHPGLSANRVTRMMCAQLQLEEEPRGSCRQQGLQYIYQQTCREKYCEMCIVGRKEQGI